MRGVLLFGILSVTMRLFLMRIFPSLFLVSLFFVPLPALAEDSTSSGSNQRVVQAPSFQQILDEGLLRAGSSAPCVQYGQCQIADILQIFLNVITLLLGISGSVFLLMFIWGGVTWLFSGGVPARFQQGLDTIRDAVIGLILVLGAYTIINGVLSLVATGTLSGGSLGDTVNNFTEVKTIEIQSEAPSE